MSYKHAQTFNIKQIIKNVFLLALLKTLILANKKKAETQKKGILNPGKKMCRKAFKSNPSRLCIYN